MIAVSQEMLEQAVLIDEYREALAQWEHHPRGIDGQLTQGSRSNKAA